MSALLCGIPVATTEMDIARLMDPEERRRDMESASGDHSRHDVEDRAKEYMQRIYRLLERKIPASDIQIYSAICGGYDTDRTDIKIFRDSPTDKFTDSVMNAKVYKILPHKFFDAPFRIWVDGNIYPRKGVTTLIKDLLGDYDIAVYRHPWRNCVYQEHAPARARLPEKYRPLIDQQIARYEKEGMPKEFGLAEDGVILSRANQITREFFERWWAEITRYSSRDQMSFPYVCWRMRDRIKVRLIDAETRFGEHFQYMTR